jgi:ubiquinone/menaquinone biosynthesis C-methylase UbiE
MASLVSSLRAEIPRDGKCLEIGVGTGRIALPLARAGVPIIGIDISREMLLRLVLNAGGTPPPIAVADATRLPFRDGAFASAIASHVFHLIPDWTRAIGELMRVVRPAGVVFASRGRRSGSGWEHQVSRRFFVEAGDPPWPPGPNTIEEVDEHMRSRGAAVRELTVLSVEGSMSIDELLANLEAGYWSACWSIDQPARVRAAAAARDWARTEFGDLAEQRPSLESSVWHTYVLPAA